MPISRNCGVSIVLVVPPLDGNSAGHGGVTGKPGSLHPPPPPGQAFGSPFTVAHAVSPPPTGALQSIPEKTGVVLQSAAARTTVLDERHPCASCAGVNPGPAPRARHSKMLTLVTAPPPVSSTTTRTSPALC